MAAEPPGSAANLHQQRHQRFRWHLRSRGRWLCAILLALVLIILLFILVVVGAPSPSSSSSSSPSALQDPDQHLIDASAALATSGTGADQMRVSASTAAAIRQQRQRPSSSSSSRMLQSLNPSSSSSSSSSQANNKLHQRDQESVCMTPGCVRAAAQLLNNLDNRTRPCDDFYQFACGRWIETQSIPDEKSALSVFSQNTADLNAKLRLLIEHPRRLHDNDIVDSNQDADANEATEATEANHRPHSPDPPIVGQMRNMYRSCMNLSEIEARGDEPLLEVLRHFGGWPVLASSASRSDKPNNEQPQQRGQLRALPLRIASSSSSSSWSSQAQVRKRRSHNQQQQQQADSGWPISPRAPARRFKLIASHQRLASDERHLRDREDQEDEATNDDDDSEQDFNADPPAATSSAGDGEHEHADQQARDKSRSPQRQQQPQLTTTTTNSGGDGGDPTKPHQQQSADWLDLIIKFRQRGFSHDIIIDLSVVPDMRNNRQYIIELDQSSLGLPDRSYYAKGLADSTVGAYYRLMVESAVMLGASRPEARRQMAEALEFESSLAGISIPREQRRNISRLYNKMLARDLYKLAPNIDWLRYLRALLKDEQVDLDSDQVIVKVPSFLAALDKLLVDTEPRVVANYMIWRIVRHSMSGLSRKWRELAHSYNTVITGRQAEEPRWEQCLGSLDGTLGTALSALYVKNYFNQRSKATALDMVDYMRDEFLKILNEIDWMDETTRQEARLKARAISAYIGYPDELLDDSLIEQLYAGLELSRGDFYQNVRKLRVWSTDYAFNYLRRPNKRGDWRKHARAAVVNAYYNSLENSIEFPAGILQGAFFDADRPQYMNFGAIGYVIGHEITHGFDDRGRQFDSEGNDRNWWKPKTDARFKERAQCIVEQYANYSLGPDTNHLRVNGINTQGENIADNGGIKQAFRAYRRWTKDNGREQRLPGLVDYTPDQLFWISAASIWCGKFRPEVLKLRINSGVHSPARFRITGPLSNSAEFAHSFGCPLGSPMNPRKKCSVW